MTSLCCVMAKSFCSRRNWSICVSVASKGDIWKAVRKPDTDNEISKIGCCCCCLALPRMTEQQFPSLPIWLDLSVALAAGDGDVVL